MTERAKTMEEIARLANVSKPTVSRALRGSPLVKPETTEKVLAVARRYGYAVNRNAQKLRQKHTDTVAVVLDFSSHRQNRVSDPFIFNLLAGVSEALGERNQDLLLCSPEHAAADSLRSIVGSRGADGIIFLGQGARGGELVELAAAGVPFVAWGAVSHDLPYCAVGSDNLRGGALAADHLLSKNRTRYLFVGNVEHMEIRLRRDGLRSRLEASGRAFRLEEVMLDDFAYATSYDSARAYLEQAKDLPDAIFACSDTTAMAFINAFRQAGVEIGKDVTVVGYNDIPHAEHFYPPLTTVHQDVHEAGEVLVAKLMQVIAGERPASVVMETKLIVRES